MGQAGQFPLQATLDRGAFEQAQLQLQKPLALTSVEPVAGNPGVQEAHYDLTLRFGPRIFVDYINARKALDAEAIHVTGRLTQGDQVIGFCSSFVDKLETPNNIKNYVIYFPVLERMNFTDIPVSCVGSAAAAEKLRGQAGKPRVDAMWTADMTLVGDREKLERKYEGAQKAIALDMSAFNLLAQAR